MSSDVVYRVDATGTGAGPPDADAEPTGTQRADANLATLRATAHPTRRAILALLREHTTLTASECGRLLGVSPKVCSYHLRVLAQQHLVAEVTIIGRNRPWRLTDGAANVGDRRAAELRRAGHRRLSVRVRRDDDLLGTAAGAIARLAHDPDWSAAVTVHAHLGSMTGDEIARWAEDVERVTRRHVRRAAGDSTASGSSTDASTADHRANVRLLFVGYPSDI